MTPWLAPALAYVPDWLAYQMRQSDQPGCVIAVGHKGRIVLEHAFGHADLAAGTKMTPRHRFRVASHSKSFTAASILRLREQGRLKLDDRGGDYVESLHPDVAEATMAQLLSHSAAYSGMGSTAPIGPPAPRFRTSRAFAATCVWPQRSRPIQDSNTPITASLLPAW